MWTGRTAVHPSRPSGIGLALAERGADWLTHETGTGHVASISTKGPVEDISNINLTVFLESLDKQIDELLGTAEEKEEAHQSLRPLREAATSVATGVGGDLIAVALRCEEAQLLVA